jgi:hypothetical protein
VEADIRPLEGNSRFDPQQSLAAKFAVMHNTAQTAMMRSVEPGPGNETTAPEQAPNELNK